MALYPLPGRTKTSLSFLKAVIPLTLRITGLLSQRPWNTLFASKFVAILVEIQSSLSTRHGFQLGLSCETQLITVIYEWARILNIHGQVVFLDLAKAFDTVPHERPLLKAKFYGISGKFNNWLGDFLTGRRQRVMVNGSSSKWSPALLSGVLQSTVLGPILFLLFINDLTSVVSSSVKLFADDSGPYRAILSPRLTTIRFSRTCCSLRNGWICDK